MNLAMVMAGAAHGGAEAFFERICAALHRAGERVLPVIRTDAARAARLRDAGLAPVELRFGGPLDLLTRPRLGRVLRGFAPRVTMTWMSRATRHAPRGDWVHVGRLGGYYDLRNFRACDHLAGNTQGLVEWIAARGWPRERLHRLPNFVADFAATPPAAERTTLLALGRLHPNKGFDVLLRAVALLPGVDLVIAGEGPERGALEALARDLGVAGRVRLPGWRQDAGALLKAARIFVCPSRQEPLGNIVIEAWSAGCPVVAADAEGPRELIADGADGLLVPKEDPGALAAAIAGLLADPVRAIALAEAGRARFARDYAEAPVVARWRDFLSTVAR